MVAKYAMGHGVLRPEAAVRFRLLKLSSESFAFFFYFEEQSSCTCYTYLG